MQIQPVHQIERIGEYLTLREASKVKGTTPNALYLWMRDRRIPLSKVGRTILVRQSDIVEYEPVTIGRINKRA